MPKGSFNVGTVARRWWRRDGVRRWYLYIVLPVVLGGTVFYLEWEADNLGAFLTGALIFAGILINIMFQVHSWAVEAINDVDNIDNEQSIGRSVQMEFHRRRLRAIARLYDSLAWGTLVALMLAVVMFIMRTEPGNGDSDGTVVVTTAVVTVLGSHLALVLVTIVNRLFAVTRGTIDRVENRSS